MRQECRLSIITVNYNGLQDTCAMLDCIPANLPSTEVIVVDNASSNDEATVLEQHYPNIRVIRSSENLGFAGGNNLGIKAASGKYLYFVNNDTEFLPFNVEPLISRMENNPNIGMVCPKIRFFAPPRLIQFAGYTPLSAVTVRNHGIGCGEPDNGQHDTAHPTPYAHGAAMMVRREAIERAGLMPEDYFLYYEELDWSVMIRRAGYEIWYEPASEIFHKESATTGQNSPLRTYYIMRNRLLFVRRNGKGLKKALAYIYIIGIVSLRDIIRHTLSRRFDLVSATINGVTDFIKGKFGKKELND